MPDFKLTLYNLDDGTSPTALAQSILEEYGTDFDLSEGAFEAKAIGNEVEVICFDVGPGDATDLQKRMYEKYGDEDDKMFIRISERIGPGWFAYEPEE